MLTKIRWGLATALLTIGPLAAGAVAEAGTPYPVVDTGQTRCYGTGRDGALGTCPTPGAALFGQDANYTIHPARYRDNGDGTVSDLVTGLMWQQDFTRDVAWRGAEEAAHRATTGGHADWRVPTTKELYSLIDFNGHQGGGRPDSSQVPPDARPFLDTRVFAFEYPTRNRYIDAQYIARTAYRGRAMGQPAFFGVNFADGRIKGYPQRGRRGGEGWYLRLVRGNPQYGINDFHDNGDGTVRDAATGLTWTRADSGDAGFTTARRNARYRDGRMDWPEALNFCEGLDFAGRTDWRLPNAKELQSLVDYTRSPQATQSAAIDPLFAVTAITDEAGKPNFPGYWTSTTLLAGRIAGSDAIVVYFGEALGAPLMNGPVGGGRPGGGSHWGGPGGGFGPQQGPGQDRRRPPDMGRPGGGSGPGMAPPQMAGSQSSGQIVDVHGAGAQRSDPKVDDTGSYPSWGHGPQGDVRRVYNYVRCVRTAE